MAYSEILKRESLVEKADVDIRELQRLIQSTCMELATHTRSSEENEKKFSKNSLQEGALRKIRIGGIQQAEELKSISGKTISRILQAKLTNQSTRRSHSSIQ